MEAFSTEPYVLIGDHVVPACNDAAVKHVLISTSFDSTGGSV